MKNKKRNRIIVLVLTALLIFNIISISCFASGIYNYVINFTRDALDGDEYYETPKLYLHNVSSFDVIINDNVVSSFIQVDENDLVELFLEMYSMIYNYNTISIGITDDSYMYKDSVLNNTLNNNDIIEICINSIYDQVIFNFDNGYSGGFSVEYDEDLMTNGYYQEDYELTIIDGYSSEMQVSYFGYYNTYLRVYFDENIVIPEESSSELSSESISESTSESTSDVSGNPVPTEILNIDQATMIFMNNTTGIYITLGCILLLVACAIVLSLIRRE